VGMATTAITDLTTASPVGIDTEIARLSEELADVEAQIARLNERIANKVTRSHTQLHADRYVAMNYQAQDIVALHDAVAAAQDFADELRPLHAEYIRRGRWNRYFLVQNANGHVHRSTSCGTCFATTSYAWLFELSDQPVAEMVEEWGEQACSLCFPEAPTFPRFSQPSKATLAERAAKAAEKAEREAAKALKVLRPEECFRDTWGKVTTVAGAKQVIRDEVNLRLGWGGTPHPSWADTKIAADRAIEVLLARGVTQAEIDKIVASATKKALKG
jgi:hypothetical protein